MISSKKPQEFLSACYSVVFFFFGKDTEPSNVQIIKKVIVVPASFAQQ